MKKIYGVFSRPADLAQFLVSGIHVYGSMDLALRTMRYPGDALAWEVHGLYETHVPEEYVAWEGHRGLLVRPTGGWRLITIDDENIDILEEQIISGVEYKPLRVPHAFSVDEFLQSYPTVEDMRDALARYRSYVMVLQVQAMNARSERSNDRKRIQELENQVHKLRAELDVPEEGKTLRSAMFSKTMGTPSEPTPADPHAAMKKLLEEHQKQKQLAQLQQAVLTPSKKGSGG